MKRKNHPRPIALLTPVAVFFGVLAALAFANGAGRSEPTSGAATAPLPAGGEDGPTGSAIASLRAGLNEDPANAGALAALGNVYYQRGRETGDAAFGRLADQAYDEALAADPESVSALVGKATTALIIHDFPGGLGLAERAHRAEPKLAATYAPLIDGLIETGRYRRAATEIERLLNLKPGAAAYARLSYLEELHGNRGAALRAMRLAAASTLPGSEPRAFALTLVGDLLFEAGRYRQASESYEQALSERDGYFSAEAGLLSVLAAEGDSEDAIAGYVELVEMRELVEYADELGRLEQAAGRPADAERHYAILSDLHATELARGQSADAGQVLFEADHGSPELGIELGAAVWEESPSVSSADAYAWALNAAGETRRAARISRRALALGTRDPLFLFHAGVIAAAAGERGRARELLGDAVEASPRFDPLFAPVAARRLEQLG